MKPPEVCETCGERKVKLTRRSTRNYTFHCPCDGKIVVGRFDVLEFNHDAAFRFVKLIDEPCEAAAPEDHYETTITREDPPINSPQPSSPRPLNPQPGDLSGVAALETSASPEVEMSGDAPLET